MGFEQGHDIVGKVKTFIICGIVLLESAKDQFLEVDLPPPPPPRKTCVPTSLVWNNLLTN
jgi:hypothetical protein